MLKRSTSHKAELARIRMRELRTREREAKRNRRRGQERYYPTPMPDSMVDKLVADLKIKKADDRPITNRKWRKLVGLLIAEAAKLTIDRKK